MDSEGGAVLVCWLVVCILMMMGGCFGWVANDILNGKERTHEQVRSKS
jgi:hypothetical protein